MRYMNLLFLLTYFLARDIIYAIARYMPSPVRPSVCPSHGWITQPSPQSSSMTLVS